VIFISISKETPYLAFAFCDTLLKTTGRGGGATYNVAKRPMGQIACYTGAILAFQRLARSKSQLFRVVSGGRNKSIRKSELSNPKTNALLGQCKSWRAALIGPLTRAAFAKFGIV